MKYKNIHLEKPAVGQLIYWLGPNGKDILGWYRGNKIYEENERAFPGFIPKWWKEAPEGLVEDPKIQPEEKKTKKSKKDLAE